MRFSSRLRKLIALTALVWLPMSVFAQVCATHAVVAGLVGSQDFGQTVALTQQSTHNAHDAVTKHNLHNEHTGHHAAAHATVASDLDAADEHGGCDQKSICAFASFAVLVSTSTDLAFDHDALVSARDLLAFSTRASAPETPPPRLPA